MWKELLNMINLINETYLTVDFYWFLGLSVHQQKIYLFDRRIVTSDNSGRRGHLERGCCWCQSVFQLGANLENSLLLRSTERMQGKQGRFTVTEDKRNWGGWDTWHYFKDGKQFEEGTDKKGKLFGSSRMSCVLLHRLSGRRNFPKSQTASSLNALLRTLLNCKRLLNHP